MRNILFIFFFYLLSISNIFAQLVGCTDSNACNYNILANLDDGSCSFTSSSTFLVSACDSYEWNDSTYTQSGTYYLNTVSNSNYSMNFDGNDDYITISNILPLNSSDITVQFWMYWDGQDMSIPINFDMYSLYFYNGSFGFDYSGSVRNTCSSLGLENSWHYITAIFSEGNIGDEKIYFNGIEQSLNYTGAGGATNGTYGSFMRIGAFNGSTLEYSGLIDNIEVWNRALNYQEIQQYMSCSPTGLEADLLAYWDFEEGSGVTILDQTVNGNDGSIIGAIYDSNVSAQLCQLSNSGGCDSIAVLNLIINNADTSYTNITSCDSAIWNGTTYTQSGSYSSNSNITSNNYSMLFNGNNYVDLGSTQNAAPTSSSDYTISLWVKPNATDVFIISQYENLNPSNSNFFLLVTQGGQFRVSGDGTNVFDFGVATIGVWQHIALVFSSNGSFSAYLDGQLITNSFLNLNTQASTYPLSIGRVYGNPPTISYNGLIDDIMIWDSALTYVDIQKYMYCPPLGSEPGLAGYWNFESGAGNTVYDITTNGGNGIINGSTFNSDIPLQLCQLTSFSGCDSTAVLNLNINNSSTSMSTITSCNSFIWNGQIISTSGAYTQTFNDLNSCDSTHILNVTINYSNTGTSQIVACESFDWNGQTIISSGNYSQVFTNSQGCDSVHNLVAIINFSNTSLSTITSCQGYTWNGNTYTSSGIYNYLLLNSAGCDSTAILNLTINNSSSSSNSVVTCDNYFWNGITYTSSGFYSHIDVNSLGCDSMAILNLVITNPTTSTSISTACGSYTWNGTIYTSSGVFTHVGVNSLGCDSIATLFLTINSLSTSLATINECDSFTWNGIAYTSSGIYTYLGINSLGCDSLATLNLTINNSSADTSIQLVCDSYIWDGVTYLFSGVYSNNYINVLGCDSMHTLILTVNSSDSVSTSVVSCDSYIWDGFSYTSSGIYSNSYVNSAGCDSLHTLNLTVNTTNNSSAIQTACDSYAWNSIIYTSSTVVTYSTTNLFGCDSIATLNLVINNSSASSITISACNSYFWNGTTYNSSGVYTFITSNANGCDSVATLNLSISYCQSTYVPDDNFEAYLEANGMGNGITNDDSVFTQAIDTLTVLDVSSLSIADLTGIEDFTALTELHCNDNLLTNIDLTSNIALTILWAYENQLTSLDVSSNTALTYLYCMENLLLSIDLSNNTNLVQLRLSNNLITFIDLTNNVNLIWLGLYNNQLTSIDLSNNTALTYLDLYTNQLTSLDLSSNIMLVTFGCVENQITSLDLSNNYNLNTLLCGDNNLNWLDLRNGNNINLSPNFHTNPSLNCVLVDDPAYSYAANWGINNIPAVSFSMFCTPQTNIPDSNFEAYLEANGIGNGVLGDDSVSTMNISSLVSLNVSAQNISDLSGIEDFSSLQTLDCSSNNISNLVLDSNTQLTSLHCSSNNLADLDVSNNAQLVNLQCEANVLTDLTLNSSIVALDCFNNQLTSLDLSNNPNISFLNCSYNNLSWIDLRNGNNQVLINPNFTGNPFCSCLNVEDPPTSDDDWPWDDPWSVYSTSCSPINSWNCFGNKCLGDSTGQGIYTSLADCQANCGISSVLNSGIHSSKQLIKVVDLLGRHRERINETILFYLFDDGTVEKRIVIE